MDLRRRWWPLGSAPPPIRRPSSPWKNCRNSRGARSHDPHAHTGRRGGPAPARRQPDERAQLFDKEPVPGLRKTGQVYFTAIRIRTALYHCGYRRPLRSTAGRQATGGARSGRAGRVKGDLPRAGSRPVAPGAERPPPPRRAAPFRRLRQRRDILHPEHEVYSGNPDGRFLLHRGIVGFLLFRRHDGGFGLILSVLIRMRPSAGLFPLPAGPPRRIHGPLPLRGLYCATAERGRIPPGSCIRLAFH